MADCTTTQSSCSSRRFCPHCSESLSLKTFKTHKHLYYDEDADKWINKSRKIEIEDTHVHVDRPLASVNTRGDCHFTDHDDAYDVSEMQQPVFSPDPQSIESNSFAPSDDIFADAQEVRETEADDDIERDVSNNTAPPIPNFLSDNEEANEAHVFVKWILLILMGLHRKHLLPAAVLTTLLMLFHAVFTILGQASAKVKDICKIFPSTLSQMEHFLKLQKDNFIKYVVCPTCASVYKYENCLEGSGRYERSKNCERNLGPRKGRCNTMLLRTVELSSGRKVLYPLKVYCYKSLIESLQEFLRRPGFASMCEEWRKNFLSHPGSYEDVYDGCVWQEFQTVDGMPFLSLPLTFGFMLNIDWFQPYKYTQYSVGAIYLVIMNLPRRLHFSRENMLLCGIIPGPHEPKLNVNEYLSPLVDDLLMLWTGVQMNVHTKGSCLVKGALLCVACDLPAARKVCGFMSYVATLGCNRCKKQFPGTVGNKDYSGFDRVNWTPRNVLEHRRQIAVISACRTVSSREEKESAFDARYSELLCLPYFDPVRMTIIDPMHCLYLGIAKRFMKNGIIDQGILSKQALKELQTRIELVSIPNTIGRIPHKVESQFGNLTADEYKNWTNIFSLLVLYELLPLDYMDCWRNFVFASRLLSKKCLSTGEIQSGDAFLLQFCCKVEALFGKSFITPNMHVACHIQDCIKDYGPIHGFWLFSFERCNGILENQPSNNRSVEVQLMRRFLYDNSVLSIDYPEEHHATFKAIIDRVSIVNVGSLSEVLSGTSSCILLPGNIKLAKHYHRRAVSGDHLVILKQLYEKLYPQCDQEFVMGLTYKLYKFIICNGHRVYACIDLLKPKIILAKWDEKLFGTLPGDAPTSLTLTYDPKVRPVIVQYFFTHDFLNGQESHSTLCASVLWLKCHSNIFKLGKPVQLWYLQEYLSSGSHSIIPVECFYQTCPFKMVEVDGESMIALINII